MVARIVPVASLACAVSLAWGAPEYSARQLDLAQRHHLAGINALRGGDLEKAARKFGAAIEVVPDFPDARLGLGHLAMLREDFEGALLEYRRAEAAYAVMGSSLAEVRMKKFSEAHMRSQEVRDQLNGLRSAVASGRVRATPEVEREMFRLEEEARRLQGIAPPDLDNLDVPPAEVDFYIGSALFNLGSVDEARQRWETARTKNPSFALVHQSLAVAYLSAGRVDDAWASLQRAEQLGLKVNPQLKRDLEARRSR